MQSDHEKDPCYAIFRTIGNYKTCQEYDAEKHDSFTGRTHAIKAVVQNKRNEVRMSFSACQSPMHGPERENDQNKTERYLRFDLPFLSNIKDKVSWEIPYARERRMSLRQ